MNHVGAIDRHNVQSGQRVWILSSGKAVEVEFRGLLPYQGFKIADRVGDASSPTISIKDEAIFADSRQAIVEIHLDRLREKVREKLQEIWNIAADNGLPELGEVPLIKDVDRLNWLERRRASVWPNDKKPGFNLFARREGRNPIQPSKESLRETIDAAMEAEAN